MNIGTSRASREIQYRDALMAAILPSPGDGLPGIADVELTDFWDEFARVAPFHLRAGLRVACLTLGVLPRLMGYGHALPELGAAAQERFIVQAASTPGLSFLVELAKVVAGLAYFTDPDVQRTARAMGARAQDHDGARS